MSRATSTILLICGSLLLVTWLVTPASSAPQANPPVRQAVDANPLPPELHDVNAQVDRLRSRLDRQVDYPEPARDPFHFAPRARVTRDAPPPVPDAMIVMDTPRLVAWPSLVAILATPDGGALQVALADRDDVLQVVSVGETTGAFTVSEITSDAVVLSDAASGQSTRLVLR